MIEYGIWSDGAGGIIEAGFYDNGPDGFALERIAEYVAEGEDRTDLRVVPVCSQHSDYPDDDCPECEENDR